MGRVELSPAAVVLSRTLLAALVLDPIALTAAARRTALRAWPAAAVVVVLEMAIPWLLLGHAEQRISSALAGLTLAVVPILGAAVTAQLGNRHNVGGHLDGVSVVELLVVTLVGHPALDGRPAVTPRWLVFAQHRLT